MEKRQNKECRCEVGSLCIESRADGEGESRTITGYAAVFESWSKPIFGYFREKIARNAFDGADFNQCIMCFNHNTSSILARVSSKTLAYEVDNKGLRFSFEAPNTTTGNDMLEMVRRGDISQCSFSFIVAEDEWQYGDGKEELAERTIKRFSDIVDMSLVVYPAYEATEASARSIYEDHLAEHRAAVEASDAEARTAAEQAKAEAERRARQEVEMELSIMELNS